jgi:hypothetical protein
MARKIIVAGNFPGPSKRFIAFATKVANGLKGNNNFASPPVTAAALLVLIAALVAADEAVDNKVPGAVADRQAKRAKVEAALQLDEAYVQTIVQAASPEDGANMLESSGYPAKKPSSFAKAGYAVTKGGVEGSALIRIKTIGRHGTIMYCHQFSLDGKVWVDVPPTLEASVTVPGLPLGQQVSFRFRTLIKGAYGDWSQTLLYLVH